MTATPPEGHVVVVDADDLVGEARAALAVAHSALAVVFERHQPVGIVTRDDLNSADDEQEPVAAVLNKELVGIDPRADDLHTLRVYNDAAWRSLRRRRGGRGRRS